MLVCEAYSAHMYALNIKCVRFLFDIHCRGFHGRKAQEFSFLGLQELELLMTMSRKKKSCTTVDIAGWLQIHLGMWSTQATSSYLTLTVG